MTRAASSTAARPLDAAVERSRRTYLRFAHPADQREWCALRESSLDHLRPWEPRWPNGSAGQSDTRFERLLRTQRTDHTRRFLLCARRTDAIVGMINLSHIARGPFQNAVLGYWLGAGHTGCGFMTEGLPLAIRHAFGRLGLHRVEANIMPHNERSLALVRRLGFREEGLSPNYLEIDGRWRDHLRFAMTAEDWKAARPRRPGGSVRSRSSPARSRRST
ncbi:MAG: GNAT family N-acetyltransferase [Phycisphaerales bacterium]